MNSIEIQAAKLIGWDKLLFQVFAVIWQLNSLNLIGQMHEIESYLHKLLS